MEKFSIGQPVRRKEDTRFLTGRGTYIDDMSFEGMAHAVVVRSPMRMRPSPASTPRKRKRLTAY